MPFNKIHVPRELPAATCRAINDELHQSLVTQCGAHNDDFFCLVVRYDPDDMIFHPTFMGERDPENTIIIEIALLGGRSDMQKAELYKDMRERLDRIGIDARRSIMFLLENQPIDWSFSPEGSVQSVLASGS